MNPRRFFSHGFAMAAWAAAISAALAALLALFAAGCGSLEATTIKQTITTVPPEMQADDNSVHPSISTDGKFVAFRSDATNLVISPTNGAHAIYVKDTETGNTTLVSSDSKGANGNKDSDWPSISGDGHLIAFESVASNLVSGDTNNNCTSASGTNISCPDIFVKNTDTGETKRLSTDAAGKEADRESQHPAISADGKFVAYKSGATNLVPGDTNSKSDIFVKNIQTGAIALASVGAGGEAADGNSDLPAISADGQFVAFESEATNLVGDDTNGKPDVFVKDMKSGAVTRVSTSAGGGQGDEGSGYGSLDISGDGHFVAFDSASTNLVDGDTNGKRDFFVKDTRDNSITLVSADAAGAPGDEDSYKSISLSNDGSYVAFSSDASTLVAGDTNSNSGKSDIFLREMQSGTITRVSVNAAGAQSNGKSEQVSICGDGHLVAFDSEASNVIDGDTNKRSDIFVKDVKTKAVTRVSTSTADTMPDDVPATTQN